MSNLERVEFIQKIFSKVTDPRSPRNSQHLLIDILIISICAVICGAEGWEAIETFGQEKEAWLKQFLLLPYGIPGHDTFRRVFSHLKPNELQACFRRWVQAVFRFTDKQVVALDGKSLRRSYHSSTDKAKGMLHMVSAWAVENQLVLGQIKTEEKSNEINAIPELLKLLAIENCIITIDAMGCQKKIAAQIIEQNADYVLAVKENQGTLHQALLITFENAKKIEFNNMVVSEYLDIDAGHGRIETRKITVLPAIYLQQFQKKWAHLQSLILIESQREINGFIQQEQRYYISSLPIEAKPILGAIRQHWSIENALHWTLDVVFREDFCRIRKDFAPENFATIRHIAINLLKQEKSTKASTKKKIFKAALNTKYLEKILEGA